MKQQWTAEELEDFWMIHPEEFKILQNKSGTTRLSFIFMLKYFQLFNHFPNDKDIIAPSVISYLAKQVDVADTLFKKANFTNIRGLKSNGTKTYAKDLSRHLGDGLMI